MTEIAVGGPPIPINPNQEGSADIQEQKQHLGMTKDSLEIPLAKMGEEERYNLQTNSSHPKIIPPTQLRSAGVQQKEEDDSEGAQQIKEMLKKQLPKDVMEALTLNGKASPEAKISALESLDTLLGTMAAILEGAGINQPNTDSSYNQITDYIRDNFSSLGQDATNEIAKNIDANRSDPNVESALNLLNQLTNSMQLLKKSG